MRISVKATDPTVVRTENGCTSAVLRGYVRLLATEVERKEHDSSCRNAGRCLDVNSSMRLVTLLYLIGVVSWRD